MSQELWPTVRVVRFHLRSMKNDELRTGSVFWFKNLQQEGGVNIVKVDGGKFREVRAYFDSSILR